jgi:integrase
VTLRGLNPDFEAHLRKRYELGKNLQYRQLLAHLSNIRNWIIGNHPIKRGKKIQVFDHGISDIKLSEIRPDTIEHFLDEILRMGRAWQTMNHIRHTLSLFLEYARRGGYMGINYAKGVSSSTKGTKRKRKIVVPPKALVSAILRAANDRDAIRIKFAALTGLRASEQWAVRWKHIDFERRRISVEIRLDEQTKTEGPPKSDAAYREVPLSQELTLALRKHQADSKARGDDDLVFPNPNGEFTGHENFKKNHFDVYCREVLQAWRVDTPKPPKPRWHDLRHFAVSCWIQAGLGPKAVQTYIGHSSIQMTMDTYGHLFPDQDDRSIMDKVAKEVLGGMCPRDT